MSCCDGNQVTIAPLIACARAIGTGAALAAVTINPVLFSGQQDASTLLTADRPDFSPADSPGTAMVTRIATVEEKVNYGFAHACFPPGHDRDGRFEINDQNNWWRFIEIIAYSYISWRNAAARAQYHWPALTDGIFTENTASVVPGAWYAITDDTLMIFVSGSSTNQQLALQAASSFAGPVTCGPVKTSSFWCSAYQYLWTQLFARHFPARPYVICAGHSYGGVMAAIFAAQIKAASPDKDVSLITYGSPCPGDAAFSDALRNVKSVHLVNRGDPVAAIPPGPRQLGLVSLLLTGVQLVAWSQWTPLHNRTAVFTDGTYRHTNDIAVTLGVLQELVITLAAGGVPAPFAAHDQWEYVRRLRITAGLPPL